jgi:hypothetical protein
VSAAVEGPAVAFAVACSPSPNPNRSGAPSFAALHRKGWESTPSTRVLLPLLLLEPLPLPLPLPPPNSPTNCHPERRHSQHHRECRSRRTCGCLCRCLFSISQPKPLGCPILCNASPQRVGINTLNSRTLAFALARASTSPTPNSPTNCHPERRHSQPHRECRSRRTCGCLCRCSCLCLPPHKSRHLNRPSPSKSPRPNESQKVQSAPGAAT